MPVSTPRSLTLAVIAALAVLGLASSTVAWLGPPSARPYWSLAFGTYLLITLLSLAPLRRWITNPTTYIFSIALCATPLAVALAYRAIGSGTIFDAAAALSILALCVVSVFGDAVSMPARPPVRSDSRSLGTAIVCTTALLVAGASVLVYYGAGPFRLRLWLATLPRVEIPGHSRMTGLVEVTVFTDYQCAVCRARRGDYDAIVNRLIAEYGPTRLTWRRIHLPADTDCNPITEDIHHVPCETAVLVRLARERGVEEAVVDDLFALQDALDGPHIIGIAKRYMLLEAYGVHYARVIADVRREADVGRALEITVMPEYFVNGLRVRGWGADDVEAVIRSELHR